MVISAKRSTNAITTIQKKDVRACDHQSAKRRDGLTVAMSICSMAAPPNADLRWVESAELSRQSSEMMNNQIENQITVSQ